jgi:hypothetical protein
MRVSDQQRESTVGFLRWCYTAGYISHATLEWRIERALEAHTEAELDGLVDDLPRHARRRLVERLRRLLARPAAPRVVRPPALVGDDRFVIGRSASANLVLRDPTVSRRHAELRRAGPSWLIVDLGSTNGTLVNGFRVQRARLREDDVVLLGSSRLVFRG